MKRDLRPIIREMRNDAKYKAMRHNFDTLPIFNLAVEELETEIARIHKLRLVRTLNVKDAKFMDKFLHANLSEIAQRSRLSEIGLECFRCYSTLADSIDALRGYMLITYSSSLSFVKTKEERLQVLDIVLSTFVNHYNKSKRLKDACDIIITDIDKAGFAMKNMVEVIKVHKNNGLSM